MHEIKTEKSDRRDAKITVWTSPTECSVTHLFWEQLEVIVAQGQQLLDQRQMIAACPLCGHCRPHDHGTAEHQHPLAPCGDPRCCGS